MAEPLLRAEDLSFSYATGLHVLDSIDLALYPGEVLSITGPSGCGKSTLLHLIAELETPSGGTLTWNSSAPTGAKKPKQRRLSVVFQRDTVLPWRTVEQNIEFGLHYIDMTPDERKERVEWMLQIGHLEDFRNAWPKQLSGGMRRRVGLLQGIAPLPEVVLLDEPFSALDEPTRVGLHGDLLDMVERLNLTLVLVTHDIAEAITLSDRVVILSTRPSRVAWSVETGFGRQRDLLAVRQTEQYARLYADTWRELWGNKGRADAGAPVGVVPAHA